MKTLFCAVLLCLAQPAFAQKEVDRYDQSGVPIEVEPTDPKLARIVLIAGANSNKEGEHEHFAGTALLMQLLKQTPGVATVMARDGWPKNEKIFAGAKTVVLYLDGGGKQKYLTPERLAILEKHVEAGGGLVHLHTAIDYPRDFGDRVLPWVGGHWDKQISCRAHWIAEFKEFPKHPIMNGVKPFSVDDGWLFHNRFVPSEKGVTTLLTSVPPEKFRSTPDAKKYPGQAESVAWTYEGPKGNRAFTFTGGHGHDNWGKESLRRFAVNGILWSAKIDIPEAGAPVALDPADLNKNMEKRKPAPKK